MPPAGRRYQHCFTALLENIADVLKDQDELKGAAARLKRDINQRLEAMLERVDTALEIQVNMPDLASTVAARKRVPARVLRDLFW